MDDATLREKIRTGLAAGVLPRKPPATTWTGPSSWKWKVCAVCGDRIQEGHCKVELNIDCRPPIYLHPRCHELCSEEIERL